MKKVILRVWRRTSGESWFFTVGNDNADAVILFGHRNVDECLKFASKLFDREIAWENDGMGDYRFVIEVSR